MKKEIKLSENWEELERDCLKNSSFMIEFDFTPSKSYFRVVDRPKRKYEIHKNEISKKYWNTKEEVSDRLSLIIEMLDELWANDKQSKKEIKQLKKRVKLLEDSNFSNVGH